LFPQASHSDLRPRSIGQLLDDAFRLFRNHFRFIFAATLCVYLPFLILQALFTVKFESVLNQLRTVKTQADLASYWPIVASEFGALLVIGIVDALLVIPLLYGSLLRLVAEVKSNGVALSFKDAFVHAWRRLLAVIGTGLLKWLLLLLFYIVGSMAVAVVAVVLGLLNISEPVTIILVVLLGIAVLCAAIWILVRLAFAMSVALEENMAGWRALVRSWQLVKGNFWRAIGFFIVVRLIVWAVEIGLSLVFERIPSEPVRAVLDNAVVLLTTPFVLITTALLYLDLRVRTDAPDLKDWLDGESPSEQ
jgi:hypothetical protein